MKRFLLLTFLFMVFAGPLSAEIESMKARVLQVAGLKDKGEIGEQPDGYLGIVKDTPEARSVVEAENKDRKEEYQKRATTQNRSVETLAVVLGEARVREEKTGRFIKKADGSWAKK